MTNNKAHFTLASRATARREAGGRVGDATQGISPGEKLFIPEFGLSPSLGVSTRQSPAGQGKSGVFSSRAAGKGKAMDVSRLLRLQNPVPPQGLSVPPFLQLQRNKYARAMVAGKRWQESDEWPHHCPVMPSSAGSGQVGR